MKIQRTKPQGKRGWKGVCSDALFGIASFINFLMPKQKLISICSTPDFSDNSRAFYEYIQKEANIAEIEDYKIVWHVLKPEIAEKENEKSGYDRIPVKFVKKNQIHSMFELFKSEYIISTHGLYSMIKLTNQQKSVLLMHGMMVKKCGFEYTNDINLGIGCGDYFFVTSEFYKKQYMKSFHCPEDKVYISGQPRNDCMFKSFDDRQQKAINEIGEHYYLFLPTYRKSNNRNSDNGENLNTDIERFGGTFDQWDILNKKLIQTNKKLVIKPHPLEETVSFSFLSKLSNVRIISDTWLLEKGMILNHLLAKSEGLITDFSGVYIDYLLLNKPICFFIPDYDKYTESRGIIFDDISKYFAGKITNDFDEITEFIDCPDNYSKKRMQINNIVNEVQKPIASKRIYEIVFGNRSIWREK